jgi:uncharacterized protein (TIRG00374 family)
VTINKRLIQAVLGAVLIGIVIWQSDPGALYSQLIDAPLQYLIPWVGGYYLIVVVSWGLGIYVLLRRIKATPPGDIILSSFKLQIFSIVVPGRIGDLGLLYFLKDNFTFGQVSAVLFVDKLITLAVNAVLAIIGLGVMLSWRYSVYAAVIMLAGLLLILWFAFKFPQDTFRFALLERLIERFRGFRVELRAVISDYNGICINLLLTISRYIFAGISVVVIFLWFGVKISLFEVILIQAVVQLAGFVPLTIMGLGVQEGLQVLLFGRMGVASEIVLAAGLWGRAIHVLFIVAIYFGLVLIDSTEKPKPP